MNDVSDRAADPTPPEGRARHLYLAHVRVRFHELDPLGHVNNAAYLNFLEQAAIDHAAAAGYDIGRLRAIGGLFIARRHEVDFLRPAYAGEWLRVVTWPFDMRGARALRAYEIRRLPIGPDSSPPTDRLIDPTERPTEGDLVVRARTEWAFVDADAGRPRRIPAELAADFLARA